MTRLLLAAVLVVSLSACFGPDPNVTDSGKGRPVLSVDFPPTATAGSVEEATLTIENPGPGGINVLQVSFALLGDPQLPDPLIGIGGEDGNPSIVSVEPEPISVSPDGAVYRFDGVAEGETKTITFEIRVPEEPGEVANSIIVGDDADIERSRGVPIRTRVQR